MGCGMPDQAELSCPVVSACDSALVPAFVSGSPCVCLLVSYLVSLALCNCLRLCLCLLVAVYVSVSHPASVSDSEIVSVSISFSVARCPVAKRRTFVAPAEASNVLQGSLPGNCAG